MKAVSANLHLMRRNGVYHYRRRVPDSGIAALGRKVIQFSLQTHDRREARRRCEIEDIKWTAQFESIANAFSAFARSAIFHL
jgi:hypothetical protein